MHNTDSLFRTKKDVISSKLREGIISGRIPRGTPLLQDRLASQFGTSITPVREALRELESEGYLVSQTHVGVTVPVLRSEDVKEAYRLRVVLEAEATRRAIPILTEEDLATLADIDAEMRTSVGAERFTDARILNHRFHHLLYSRGQTLAPRFINVLWARFPFEIIYLEPTRLAAAVDEHASILAALRSRDADAAVRAVKHHIDSGWRLYLENKRNFERQDAAAAAKRPVP